MAAWLLVGSLALLSLLAVPASLVGVQCLLGAWARTRRCRHRAAPDARVAVLVPAHDEEAGIEATLEALLAELGPDDRLLVVADNCQDATAARARRAGAEVALRRDPARRGKGYALAFGVEHLRADPPDVVVVVDADCLVQPGSIRHLGRHALAAGRPVQADYLLSPPAEADPGQRLSAFALVTRNRVRPRGMRALGLPCPLFGSGMALPWELLRGVDLGGAHLTEDLLLGVELACRGTPAEYCPDAVVSSLLPVGAQAGRTQRRRWEHGSLSVLVRHGPRLFAAAARRRSPALLGLALDLAVPPTSLLVLLLLIGWLGAALALLAGAGPAPLLLASSCLAFLALGLGAAWWSAGRALVDGATLAAAPGYLWTKLALYLELVRSGPERRWVRTARDPDRV